MENSAGRYNCCDGAVFVGNRGTSTPFRGQERLKLGAFGVGVKRGQTSFRRELTRVDSFECPCNSQKLSDGHLLSSSILSSPPLLSSCRPKSLSFRWPVFPMTSTLTLLRPRPRPASALARLDSPFQPPAYITYITHLPWMSSTQHITSPTAHHRTYSTSPRLQHITVPTAHHRTCPLECVQELLLPEQNAGGVSRLTLLRPRPRPASALALLNSPFQPPAYITYVTHLPWMSSTQRITSPTSHRRTSSTSPYLPTHHHTYRTSPYLPQIIVPTPLHRTYRTPPNLPHIIVPTPPDAHHRTCPLECVQELLLAGGVSRLTAQQRREGIMAIWILDRGCVSLQGSGGVTSV